MSTTVSPTERRYRRLLLLLPSWYRERYSEEMVEVYLAGRSGQDDGRPGAAEVAATVRLAVSTRAQRAGAPSRSTLVLIAVAGSAALAATALFRLALAAVSVASQDVSWFLGADGRLIASVPTFGVTDVVGLPGLMWVVVLVTLLAGFDRIATVLAALSATIAAGGAFSPFFTRDAAILELALARTDARSALLPLVILSALVLAGASANARPTTVVRLIATGATVTALAVGLAVGWAATYSADGTTWSISALAVAASAVAVLVLSRRVDPAWPATVLTLAFLVVLAGPLPAGTLLNRNGYQQTVTEGPLDPVLVPGLVIAAVATTLAALAWIASTDRHPDHTARARRRTDLATN